MGQYNIPEDTESMKYSEYLQEYLLKHELSYFSKIKEIWKHQKQYSH